MNGRVAFFFVLAVASAATGSALAQGGNTLPLQRGFYVNTRATCAQASNATLQLVTRDGMNVSQAATKFAKVQKVGPTTYQVTQTVEFLRGGGGAPSKPEVQVYEVPSSTAFSFKNAAGSFSFRYCPQSSLPDPWRSNDIRSLIN